MEKWTKYNFASQLFIARINCIENAEGPFFIGTDKNLILIDKKNVEYFQLPYKYVSHDSLGINSLYFEKDKNVLWVGTSRRGMYMFENKEWKDVTPASFDLTDIHSGYISSITKDVNNAIWYSHKSSLIKIVGENHIEYVLDLPEKDVKSVCESIKDIKFDSKNVGWVFSDKNLFRFENGRAEIVQIELSAAFKKKYFSFPIYGPRSLNIDSKDNIWLMVEAGEGWEYYLFKYDSSKFVIYPITQTPEGFKEYYKDPQSWLIGKANMYNDDLFVATHGGGLLKFSNKKWTTLKIPKGKSIVHSMYVSSDIIWMGTDNGLYYSKV